MWTKAQRSQATIVVLIVATTIASASAAAVELHRHTNNTTNSSNPAAQGAATALAEVNAFAARFGASKAGFDSYVQLERQQLLTDIQKTQVRLADVTASQLAARKKVASVQHLVGAETQDGKSSDSDGVVGSLTNTLVECARVKSAEKQVNDDGARLTTLFSSAERLIDAMQAASASSSFDVNELQSVSSGLRDAKDAVMAKQVQTVSALNQTLSQCWAGESGGSSTISSSSDSLEMARSLFKSQQVPLLEDIAAAKNELAVLQDEAELIDVLVASLTFQLKTRRSRLVAFDKSQAEREWVCNKAETTIGQISKLLAGF